MARLCISLLLLSTAGCTLNPVGETNANKIAVFAVLGPDYPRQKIMLVEGTSVIDVEGLYPGELDRPLRGAKVMVSGNHQTIQFTEVSPGLYQDVTTPLQVVAGERYFLEVQDAGGSVLSAYTRVPGAFNFTTPSDSARFGIDTLIFFRWQGSVAAGIYVLGRNLSECERDFGGRNFGIYESTRDTQEAIIAWINPFCNSSPDAQTVKVLAYDSSFATYIYSVDSNGTPLRLSNIDGGFGVFGSMVSDSVTIVVTAP